MTDPNKSNRNVPIDQNTTYKNKWRVHGLTTCKEGSKNLEGHKCLGTATGRSVDWERKTVWLLHFASREIRVVFFTLLRPKVDFIK